MLADTYERLVNLDGKQILITGGYGFIGSHLAEQLASNNNVTIVDRSENQIGGEGMEGIEVIENTSTTDMTSNSSIDDTSKIITVSGLPTSPIQTYQFNVTYLKLADGVNPTTNSLIRLLPIGIIFGIMGVTTFGLMSRM